MNKLELIIRAFGELSDDTWQKEVFDAKNGLIDRIAEFDKQDKFDATVESVNIGRGADWTVLAVYFGLAAMVIPELHKRIRENIEEWHRIYGELHRFFSWIINGKQALYPDEYLFLKAVEELSANSELDLMAFKGVVRIPNDNPDRQGREDLLISFGDNKRITQVAISRWGDILWKNTIEM